PSYYNSYLHLHTLTDTHISALGLEPFICCLCWAHALYSFHGLVGSVWVSTMWSCTSRVWLWTHSHSRKVALCAVTRAYPYSYMTISFHAGFGSTAFLVNEAPPVPTTMCTVA